MINSGVYVQNNYNSDADVKIKVTPKEVSERSAVVYFIGEEEKILNVKETVEYILRVENNNITNIPLFWKYEDGVYGNAEIFIELLRGNKKISSMTLKYLKEDTGIDNVLSDDAKCNIYDSLGRLIKRNVKKSSVYAMEKGVYIIQVLSDKHNLIKIAVN